MILKLLLKNIPLLFVRQFGLEFSLQNVIDTWQVNECIADKACVAYREQLERLRG